MAGFRSLLAKWLGGAGAVPPPPAGGFRSLLAFWLGGATAPAQAPEPEPQPEPSPGGDGGGSSGGGVWITPPQTPHDVRGAFDVALHVSLSAEGSVDPVAAHGAVAVALSVAIEAHGTVDNSLPVRRRREEQAVLAVLMSIE